MVVANGYKTLLFGSLPTLRDRFVLYGARSGAEAKTEDAPEPSSFHHKSTSILLDKAASLRVPHAWFLHFYIVSVASSFFWASQILDFGYPLRVLCANPEARLSSSSMTANQIALVWLLMATQGLRRLFESVVFQKKSESTMFVVHWALGLSFYIAMGIAVWIEGAGKPSTLFGCEL